MIVNLSNSNKISLENLPTLVERDWKNKRERLDEFVIASPESVKVPFESIILPMPLLFLSGMFLGIAIMLSIGH